MVGSVSKRFEDEVGDGGMTPKQQSGVKYIQSEEPSLEVI